MAGAIKVVKTKKMGKQNQNRKKNKEKEKKRQKKKHSTKPKFPQAKEQQRNGQRQKRTVPNGNCGHEKTCNKNIAKWK